MKTHQKDNKAAFQTGLTLLKEGKILKVKAEGYSMYPVIKPGEIILIDPIVPGQKLMRGNIVAWERDSGLVLHRLTDIIEKENTTCYITRGDSCAHEDDAVTIDKIAGMARIDNCPGDKFRKPHYRCNQIRVWLLIKYAGAIRLFIKLFLSGRVRRNIINSSSNERKN